MTTYIILILGGFGVRSAMQAFHEKKTLTGYAITVLSGFLILSGMNII
mgnify:CR=1|jgi:uncharacterized membrane protein YsdA (DUF1294 family)|tara:strand:+ start:7824 stop:7967 length:144 start_codon:yes stop_codon:yes gene_type:complete